MDYSTYWVVYYFAHAFIFFFAPSPFPLVWGMHGFLKLPPSAFQYSFHVYCATTVLAALCAHRLRFDEYDGLRLVRGTKSAFFGCLLCWHVCFPVFLYNCYRVLRKKIVPRRESEAKRGNNEFQILLILQGLAVWMAMAIPGCLPTPRRAQEANAVSTLKSYASAQATFSLALRKGMVAAGTTTGDAGYCDNFRNLHYGLDKDGKQLGFISRPMADAFGTPATGAPTAGDAPEEAVPFREYLFVDDPFITQQGLWKSAFGLFAVPVQSGYNMFWIGKDGYVYRRQLPADVAPPAVIGPEDSPLSPGGGSAWDVL